MPSLDDVLTAARRIHVGTVAWAAFLLAAGTAQLAFGFWPAVHPGFVRNDIFQTAVNQVSEKTSGIVAGLRRHQALDDAAKILDLKEKECMLPKDAPKDVYSRDILSLDQDYQDITGQPYNIPACENL
jgi:hypothetical protein